MGGKFNYEENEMNIDASKKDLIKRGREVSAKIEKMDELIRLAEKQFPDGDAFVFFEGEGNYESVQELESIIEALVWKGVSEQELTDLFCLSQQQVRRSINRKPTGSIIN